MSADGKYHPPKWCRSPTDPARHAQTLHFVRSAPGGSADAAGVASSSVVAEISDKAVYTIGRGDKSDVRLRGDLASRLHAAVLQDADGVKFLVDMRSTHGTFLGEKRLTPHEPVKWTDGAHASFGSGAAAEVLTLRSAASAEAGGISSPPEAKRRRLGAEENESASSGEEGVAVANPPSLLGGGGGLFDDLPEATTTEFVPKVKAAPRLEPIKVEEDPTKIIFLDIDGVLRPLHSRQDAWNNVKTIEINGARVPLMGNSEAKAGVDFWPSAMRALRYIVQKSGARIVLSSDWRKEEVLREGIAASFEEYRMPPVYSQTPDLDAAAPGVLKTLHSSFREKRCKEIRKWVKGHTKVVRWVSIDDVDLSLPDKEAKLSAEQASIFLDPSFEFVRTNPTTGLTMDLAKLAICYLNGTEASEELLNAAYGASSS